MADGPPARPGHERPGNQRPGIGVVPRRVWVLAVLVTLLGLAVGFGTKASCLATARTDDGQAVLDWSDWRQYRTYCYSDTIPLYGLEKLSDGGLPYRTAWRDPGSDTDRYMEYPVATGMLQYGVMVLTKSYLQVTGQAAAPDPPEVVVYFVLMALVLSGFWLVAMLATVPLLARPWHVGLIALSPIVLVHVFTNFDALAVALAAAGMLAWTRGKPWAAGILLGVGAAAKLYPLFVLGPLLILCWRGGTLREWSRATAGTVLAWLAVNLPIALLYPRGWWEFFRLNSTRPADHDSVYNAVSVLTGWAGFDGPPTGEPPRILNAVSLALFALACLVIAWIAARATEVPRLSSLVFLVVAAFLLTNKVWSPQYSLWLVPLAVLALPRVLPLLAWMTLDAYLWVPRLQYFLGLAEPGEGTTPETFVTVVLLRDAAVLVLCLMVVRTIRRPDSDPYRAALDQRSYSPVA